MFLLYALKQYCLSRSERWTCEKMFWVLSLDVESQNLNDLLIKWSTSFIFDILAYIPLCNIHRCKRFTGGGFFRSRWWYGTRYWAVSLGYSLIIIVFDTRFVYLSHDAARMWFVRFSKLVSSQRCFQYSRSVKRLE